ncbi:class I SAM-dependent methyltransferase [Paenibacillus albiflavus]|uniref:Class I SAM-dependent methyltransferase n=2 Tax=Paenibacillus albiflavus TaxID=2545760 RepID=A0A4R4EE85_9BACL|nr:class I SAM-dependent methyltransferase [Paenibacillus albiflavus]
MDLDAHLGNDYPYSEEDFEKTLLTPSYRVELRNATNEQLDRFISAGMVNDWSLLSWKEVGRPYRVENMAEKRVQWENEHGRNMPVHKAWEMFNRSFHEWFVKDVPSEKKQARQDMFNHLAKFDMKEVRIALKSVIMLNLWNYAHRVKDGIWDPRGKRALFQGLHLKKPRILFLGAAEGYEAMQLYSMYPDGEIVMVDYDEYCKTDRFAQFPDTYPFLGYNSATGQSRVWYKDQMNITYIVDDIRNLPFGHEFDIVLSVGLLEHFSDEVKPEVMEWHRKFLKPGGYAILTTPRNQLQSKVYYKVMEDVMNHTYRELMDIRQMGLYVYENGFDILKHGYIKVHNGIIAQPR